MDPDELTSLVRAGRRNKLFEPAGLREYDLSRAQIEELVPHRAPFLFLDGVTAVDLQGLMAVGRRRIDQSDPIFLGHFPGTPIYPGVLQLEIMGQLGLCLLGLAQNELSAASPSKGARQVRILKIHHALFLMEVKPGDDLVILAKVVNSDEVTAICAGQILRGETICAFAVMEVYFVDA